jgi:hypothetical protein
MLFVRRGYPAPRDRTQYWERTQQGNAELTSESARMAEWTAGYEERNRRDRDRQQREWEADQQRIARGQGEAP